MFYQAYSGALVQLCFCLWLGYVFCKLSAFLREYGTLKVAAIEQLCMSRTKQLKMICSDYNCVHFNELSFLTCNIQNKLHNRCESCSYYYVSQNSKAKLQRTRPVHHFYNSVLFCLAKAKA